MRHDLKTWPKFFDMVRRGVKTFEVRSNDREFKECDTLLLREYDPDAKVFTGNTLTCDVTCIVSGAEFGIKPGYVVMGIKVTGSRIANSVIERTSRYASRRQLRCVTAAATDCADCAERDGEGDGGQDNG